MSREERRSYQPKGSPSHPGVVRRPEPKFEPELVRCGRCGVRVLAQEAAAHLGRCGLASTG